MKNKLLIFTCLTCILAFVAYFLIGFESYCWWNPSIDTQFTQNYSEEKFLSIKQGMTEDQVAKLVGEPFSKHHEKRADIVIWYYSTDGKSKWGDWAWLSKGVYFQNKHVIKTESSVVYD